MIQQFKIVKSHGWMVGNSPVSDINPSLQAGLNAVFIPHSATWELEKAQLESGAGKLLILSVFRRAARAFLAQRLLVIRIAIPEGNVNHRFQIHGGSVTRSGTEFPLRQSLNRITIEQRVQSLHHLNAVHRPVFPNDGV